jgi:hypothetical protein
MLSTIFNISRGDTTGGMLAGIFNICDYSNSEIHGAQVAGIFNYTGTTLYGFQASAIFNYSGKDLYGLQASGFFNSNTNTYGAQISAGVNTTKALYGAQIGLVNLAEEAHGVQIGLVNIAEENDGLAIGLFNYAKNGIHNFEIWFDQDMNSSLGFKFGTKYFYSIVLGGYNFKSDNDLWQFGVGWGVQIPIQDFYIDCDVLFTSMHSKDLDLSVPFEKTLLPHVRLKAGFTLFNMIGLFAGVDFQFHSPYMYYDASIVNQAIFEYPSDFHNGQNTKVVPRFFFGVQLLD